MKILFFLPILVILNGCSKPKTVFICGDHVCINKTEAEQYFEENLSLEVKVIDKKKKEELNLVELNLKEPVNGEKTIFVTNKKKTNNEIKILSNKEIESKKAEIKEKNKIKKNKKTKNKKFVKKTKDVDINKNPINDTHKQKNEIVDICVLVKECNIDEISKFLVKQGKKKKFPDINLREDK
tara:strand:+ start:2390 stop:2935 length:546 start_codon:yes stop_codon:yes gene_type:complete